MRADDAPAPGEAAPAPPGPADGLRACPLPAQVRTRERAVVSREAAAKVVLYVGAALVVVERARAVESGRKRYGRGERRASCRFSPRQRTAFLRALATVDESAPALFVTLTWPTWAAPEGREWQEAWNRFRMTLARHYPQAAGFYKRELTKAGVVHLHLLVYGVTWRQMREFVPSAWARSVHAPDPELRERVGTQVARATSGEGVRRYAAKYVTKAIVDDDGQDPSGPWWGRFNEGQIPTVVPVALAVPDPVAVRMIRTARRLLDSQRYRKEWARLVGHNKRNPDDRREFRRPARSRWHRFNRVTVIADPDVWRKLAALYASG